MSKDQILADLLFAVNETKTNSEEQKAPKGTPKLFAENSPKYKKTTVEIPLEYFGCKDLEEYFNYLIASTATLEKQSKITEADLRRIITSGEITPEDLKNPQFFHNFLTEFHSSRARSAASEEREIKTTNRRLSEKTAGGSLYAYENPRNPQRYVKDTSDISELGGVRTFYSETIGVSEGTEMKPGRNTQEDAFFIGNGLENGEWGNSANVPSLLRQQFLDLGKNIRNYCIGKNEQSGSTAIVAHYAKDRKLTLANLGDSRAVLFIKTKDGKVESIRLTNDQEPRDIIEHGRIAAKGGSVVRDRINGLLMVGRAFGDTSEDLEGFTDQSQPNGQKLVSYEPDIYQYDIADIMKKYPGGQALLMTSCDGMYDHGTGNEATYAQALESWFRNEDNLQAKWSNNVAEYLRDYAIALGSKDNVTTLISDITNAPTQPLSVGVFDGHGGAKVAALASEALASTILQPQSRVVHHVQFERDEIIQLVSEFPTQDGKQGNVDDPIAIPNRVSFAQPQASQTKNTFAAIDYEIDEDTKTLTIKSLRTAAELGIEDVEYQNLFDVEFAPIIKFYKNHGQVNGKATSSLPRIQKELNRLTPNSRITTPDTKDSFDTLKTELSNIEISKRTLGKEQFLTKIAELEIDADGYITQGSFFRHYRKDKTLPGLTKGYIDGNYWYGSKSIQTSYEAYILDAGFAQDAANKRLYKKGDNLVFVGMETESHIGGSADLRDTFQSIRSQLKKNNTAKIFVPVNHNNAHWTMLEVTVTHGADGKFAVCNRYFDPSGYAREIRGFDDTIESNAKTVFGDTTPFISIAHESKKQSDASSCGPISCYYIKQRLEGKSCGQSGEKFEPGARDLRSDQVKLVAKHFGEVVAEGYYRSLRSKVPNTTNTSVRTENDYLKALEALGEVPEGEFGFFHSAVSEIVLEATTSDISAADRDDFIEKKVSEFGVNLKDSSFLKDCVKELLGSNKERAIEALKQKYLLQKQEAENLRNTDRAEEAKAVFARAMAKTSAGASPQERAKLRDELVESACPDRILNELREGIVQGDTTEFINFALDAVMPNDQKLAVTSVIRWEDGEKPTTETQTKLELDFSLGSSIQEMISAYQGQEDMNGENQYETDDGRKVDATKRLQIAVQDPAAEICLSIKRFKYAKDSKGRIIREKINSSVDLSGTISIPLANGSRNQEYELTSFVVHSGSLDGGHYFSYVKEINEDGHVVWARYNDNSRTELKGEDLPEDAQRAYVTKFSPVGGELPRSQQNGTINGGNRCWANAGFAFLMSMQSLRTKELEAEVERPKANTRDLILQPSATASEDEKNLHNMAGKLLDIAAEDERGENNFERILELRSDPKFAANEAFLRDQLFEYGLPSFKQLFSNAATRYLQNLLKENPNRIEEISRLYEIFLEQENYADTLEFIKEIEENKEGVFKALAEESENDIQDSQPTKTLADLCFEEVSKPDGDLSLQKDLIAHLQRQQPKILVDILCCAVMSGNQEIADFLVKDCGVSPTKKSELYDKTATTLGYKAQAKSKTTQPLPKSSQSLDQRGKALYLTPQTTSKHISPAAVFDPATQAFRNIETSSKEPQKKVIVITSGAFLGCKSKGEAVATVKKLIDEGFTVLLRDSYKTKFTKHDSSTSIQDKDIAWSSDYDNHRSPLCQFVDRSYVYSDGRLEKDDYTLIAENFRIPREQLLVLAHLSPEEKHQALPGLFDAPRPKAKTLKTRGEPQSGPRIILSSNRREQAGEVIRDKVYGRNFIQSPADLLSKIKPGVKNILIKVDGEAEDLEAHANYLIAQATAERRPVFCLESFDQIHSGKDNLVFEQKFNRNTGKTESGFKPATQSPLIAFLQKCKTSNSEPLIIIDWSKFDAKQKLALNSLIDQERKIGDETLSAGTQIVSLASARTIGDVSFESRHDFSARSDLAESELEFRGAGSVGKKGKSGISVALRPKQISIASTDWKDELLGHMTIEAGDFGENMGRQIINFHGGGFEQRIPGASELRMVEFSGVPEQSEKEFLREFKRARAFGKFIHHGHEFEVPGDIHFNLTPFDFGQFNKAELITVAANATYSEGEHQLINSQLFPLLIRDKKIEDGKYSEIDGLIDRTRKAAFGGSTEPLKLFISSPLSEGQWNHLFSEAFKAEQLGGRPIKLDLRLAPGVELPEGVAFTQSEALLPTPTKPKAKIHVVEDADIFCKSGIMLDTYAVIDVTDLTYQDLAGKFTFDAGKNGVPTNFRKIPGILQSEEKIILKGVFSPELLQMLERDILECGENITFVIEEKDPQKRANYEPLRWLDKSCYEVRSESDAVLMEPLPSTSITSRESGDWNSLENSATAAQRFIEEREENFSRLLSGHQMIQLNGHSGVGKSSLIREYEDKHKGDTTIYRDLSSLKNWAKDTSARTKILFIDESNIEDSHLTIFDPLKPNGNRRIFYQGEFIELSEQHKVVFSCNPKEYGGGRMDQRLFEDGSIPAQKLYGFPACYIYEKLIKEAIGESITPEFCAPLIEEFRQNQQDPLIADEDKETVRELQQKVLIKLAEVDLEKEEIKSANFISTEATSEVEDQLVLALKVKELQRAPGSKIKSGIGLNGVLLEGDSGTGKSELIKAVLESRGIEENTPKSADSQCYYKIDPSLPREEKLKIITKAYEEGNIVWIDEINSCLDDGLEKALNLALTGDHPAGDTGKAVKPGFMLISSINSINLEGRSEISPALRHRTIQPRVKPAKEYSREDLTKIARHWLEDESTQREIIAVMKRELDGYTEKEPLAPLFLTCFHQRAENEMKGKTDEEIEAKAREYLQEAKDQFDSKHPDGKLNPEFAKRLSESIGERMQDSFKYDPNIVGFRAFKDLLPELAAKSYVICYEVDYGLEPHIPTTPPPEPGKKGVTKETVPPLTEPKKKGASPKSIPTAAKSAKSPSGYLEREFAEPFVEGENLKIEGEKIVVTAKVKDESGRDKIGKDGKAETKKVELAKSPLIKVAEADPVNNKEAGVAIDATAFRKAAKAYYDSWKVGEPKENRDKETGENLAGALNVYLASPGKSPIPKSVRPLSPTSVTIER
jgi:serine/threonine protein phosphatase PrpC